eukprot:3160016-Rhodomonas_salina.1
MSRPASSRSMDHEERKQTRWKPFRHIFQKRLDPRDLQTGFSVQRKMGEEKRKGMFERGHDHDLGQRVSEAFSYKLHSRKDHDKSWLVLVCDWDAGSTRRGAGRRKLETSSSSLSCLRSDWRSSES